MRESVGASAGEGHNSLKAEHLDATEICDWQHYSAAAMPAVALYLSEKYSGAPSAGQHKAGRSDFQHFAIRPAPGENAENADLLSCLACHTENRGLRKFLAPKRGKRGQRKRGKCG